MALFSFNQVSNIKNDLAKFRAMLKMVKTSSFKAWQAQIGQSAGLGLISLLEEYVRKGKFVKCSLDDLFIRNYVTNTDEGMFLNEKN